MIPEDVKFCVRCGTQLESGEEFGRLRPKCPTCGWIFFADPKVAAGILLQEGRQVLLVRRVNEPFRGSWSLPAGFVDAGEDPRHAAERECLEETGLRVRAGELVDVVGMKEHARGADFVIVYRGRIEAGEPVAGDDADRVEWFNIEELPPLAFEATQSILSGL